MEYNKKLMLCLVVVAICSCSGCKTSFPYGKKAKKEKGEWVSVLQKGDISVKKYWIDLIDGDFESLNSHQIFLKGADISKLELKPILVYSLDSTGILAINNKSSLPKILVLEKSKAIYYGLIKDTIKVMIYPQYTSNTFSNGNGYSGVFPLLERKLVALRAKNIEFYWLDVIAFPSSKSRLMSYLFYVNNKGEFMSLQSDGSEVSLKGLLVALRQRVLEIQKTL